MVDVPSLNLCLIGHSRLPFHRFQHPTSVISPHSLFRDLIHQFRLCLSSSGSRRAGVGNLRAKIRVFAVASPVGLLPFLNPFGVLVLWLGLTGGVAINEAIAMLYMTLYHGELFLLW